MSWRHFHPLTYTGLIFIASTFAWANLHEFHDYPPDINDGYSYGWPCIIELRPSSIFESTVPFQRTAFLVNVLVAMILLTGFVWGFENTFVRRFQKQDAVRKRIQFHLATGLLLVLLSATIAAIELHSTAATSIVKECNKENWRYEKQTRGFPWVWWSKYTSSGGENGVRWILAPNGRSTHSGTPEYVIIGRGLLNNCALAAVTLALAAYLSERQIRRRENANLARTTEAQESSAYPR